ncbi:hypothetical protein NQ317_001682 [Molorchus minor]|uniref:Uncharacterized protein n=1 Tax=Molorchus minor TaxID=1323400 RepID=A0ABQ9JIQ1_9CUCU|nr:hypothetical protein NQ317_001682 [Molorchus minor]
MLYYALVEPHLTYGLIAWGGATNNHIDGLEKAVFCFVAVAVAHAGHLGVGLVGPSTHGVVIQGPGAKAALVGPDGSHISAAVAGGTIVAPPKSGGGIVAAAAPGYVAAAVPLAAAYPVAPIGIHAGIGLVGAPAAYGIAPGSGHEGQWVPDYTDKLYDDGSYKGEYYGHY